MIGILGAGAFGTAIAVALASDGTQVSLWARNRELARMAQKTRENVQRLPGVPLPPSLEVTSDIADLAAARAILVVVPAQQTASLLAEYGGLLPDVTHVFCAKGIARDGLKLQTELVSMERDKAVLTGPGFANEIARGLPTALTLAVTDPQRGAALQTLLSRPALRLYLSSDPIGAQLGGALKNVVAIAAGIAIGAGLGESARAAIITRGFAEMSRLALKLGADARTLAGLSGFGDLALTATSGQSRNFAHGQALGSGSVGANVTVEGAATARISVDLAARHGVEMPIAEAVASVLEGRLTVDEALQRLLARPLAKE